MGRSHFVIEVNIWANAILARASGQVSEQLIALGVVIRPSGVGLKGVRVEVVWHIDAAAGIGILVPRSADTRILLEDRVRHTESTKLYGHAEPRDTSADDQGVEFVSVSWRRHAPVHRALSEADLFADHRFVLGRDGFGNARTHCRDK
jgi:hypothetical protein